jgi:hypothetical protein
MHLNSSKFEIIGKWFKVQQAALESPKKASTYSAQRLEAIGCVEIVFYGLIRRSSNSPTPVWDSGHVKCCLLAQQWRCKYAESLPHILRPRSGPSIERLADFLRHPPPSTGDCAVKSVSIRAALLSAEVPGTGRNYRIERL